MPHGMCYEWNPHVIWLHVLSDGLIALAYYSIPLTLIYFVRKRQDLAFDWIFVCFAIFIVACGTTHLMEILNIWHPTYWLSGLIKAITAVTSVITAILLVRLVPGALAIPSPDALRRSNEALQREIEDRRKASLEIEGLNRELVAQTERIQASNKELESFVAREQELRIEAEAAERAKGEFLAIMSHEIRTPLNGVVGMTSLLSDTELTERQNEYVNIIKTSGESLLEVINGILDFSKITSGRMSLEKRPLHLRECVEEVLDIFASQLRLKGLEGIYQIAPDVPLNLVGDSMRLRQILVNLVGNALKFTSQGEIVVEVKVREQDAERYLLLFSVRDTGIGIDSNSLDKLFRAFQQADTSTTRKYGGTGLGLAISKSLAELMEGEMWAESEVGVGSTFFFTGSFAPLKESSPVERTTFLPRFTQSLSILVVDDNITNRHVLRDQLTNWGMKPVMAASAEDALRLLETKPFDLALLDYHMPGVDGLELARRIRRTSQIPLMLLSSSADLITGEDALLFQAQVLKPIKHSALLAAIFKLTGVRQQPASRKPGKVVFDRELAQRHPLRILVAEDNLVNQKVALRMLSQFGYAADLACDGREALDCATQKNYDLILMDIQMPEMDGIQSSTLIRQRTGTLAPFIVALTAEALEGDRDRFLALGFDGYLSKPLQAESLREILTSAKPHLGN
jgi:signal transduction histidine kinase/CheY-like chemotaxis protein